MSLISRIGKFFGGHFAPDNTVVPVLNSGRFNRLAGPGHFYVKPIVEKTLEPISLGLQVGKFTFEDVLSKDNIPFQMQITILFRFDPTLPDKRVLPQLVRLTLSMLEMDMGVNVLEAEPLGAERYAAEGSQLSMVGDWQVAVLVRRATAADVEAVFTVPVGE